MGSASFVALVGAGGIALGALIGALGGYATGRFTARAERRRLSRVERRSSYLAWLEFGFTIPATLMELARAADVDATVSESVADC